nr:uncharacterized protein LOC112017298 [Quercus suber]
MEIMEVLSKLLRKTEESNLIRGFHVGAVNFVDVRISHLLFVEDTILFCDASREQMMSIRLAFSCFQAFTGLKVNVGKSEIVPVGEVNNLDALANILQYRVGNLPIKYLGMPLGTSFKSTSIWNPSLEKMEKKLSRWKRLYLSKGVGDGTHIRFWHDRWIGDNTLKNLYPEIYMCSAAKDACIFEVLWTPEGGTVRVWDLRFYRAFEDWELAASYSLIQFIQSRIPQVDMSNSLCWRLKCDAAHDRILTLDNLMLRGHSLANRCCFWYKLSYAKMSGRIVILLTSVAWEAQIERLEFDSKLLNVDYLVGTKSSFL